MASRGSKDKVFGVGSLTHLYIDFILFVKKLNFNFEKHVVTSSSGIPSVWDVQLSRAPLQFCLGAPTIHCHLFFCNADGWTEALRAARAAVKYRAQWPLSQPLLNTTLLSRLQNKQYSSHCNYIFVYRQTTHQIAEFMFGT